MPMKYDPSVIVSKFNALPNKNETTLRKFVNDNFEVPGSDINFYVPSDWHANPAFLDRIKNDSVCLGCVDAFVG